MIAGMQGWNADEDLILKELGIRHIPPAVLADSSRPILDWIETEGITHLAVHFDLDVLDPAHFSPLLFNRPGMPEGAFDGIEQGRMQLDQVVRRLKEIGAARTEERRGGKEGVSKGRFGWSPYREKQQERNY